MAGMKPRDVLWYGEAAWDPARAKTLDREIAAYPFSVSGRRVLDLAAGAGDFALACLQAGASSVTWHDIEPGFLSVAAARLGTDRVRYELRDMMDLPYQPSSFDLVVLRAALHWARDEAELFRRLARVLAPEGWLVIQATSWRRAVAVRRIGWKAPFHLLSPLLAVVVRRKLLTTLWSLRSLTKKRLERAGFEVVESRPPVWAGRRAGWFELIARRVADPNAV